MKRASTSRRSERGNGRIRRSRGGGGPILCQELAVPLRVELCKSSRPEGQSAKLLGVGHKLVVDWPGRKAPGGARQVSRSRGHDQLRRNRRLVRLPPLRAKALRVNQSQRVDTIYFRLLTVSAGSPLAAGSVPGSPGQSPAPKGRPAILLAGSADQPRPFVPQCAPGLPSEHVLKHRPPETRKPAQSRHLPCVSLGIVKDRKRWSRLSSHAKGGPSGPLS